MADKGHCKEAAALPATEKNQKEEKRYPIPMVMAYIDWLKANKERLEKEEEEAEKKKKEDARSESSYETDSDATLVLGQSPKRRRISRR